MGDREFKIAVLASTNGTDLQAIIDAMNAGEMPGIELVCVASNKKNCGAITRARAQGYETVFVSPFGKSREEYDRELADALRARDIDLVVLVGYMRILTPEFIRAFQGRIINVHPSLLPKFGGRNFFGRSVHEAVLAAGATETGMTIHHVTEEVDGGPIILQKKVAVAPDDTPETLKEKVQALEKEWYPKVIRQIADGAI